MIVTTRQHPDGIEIVEYTRDEFVSQVWEYRPGEHVSLIGPTEAGKTTLGYQLLNSTTTPRLPAVVLVMKPRDKTVVKWGQSLGYVTVKSWPPTPTPFKSERPRGFTLWPPHDLQDFAGTNVRMYLEFRKAVLGVYGHQKTRAGRKLSGMIVFADELAGLVDELGMMLEVKMMYSRGRTMDAGIWGATQRPVDIPRLAYSSAHHLFLSYMPDEGDRKRFGEIGGGIDPKMIEEITLQLPQYWWLYVRRRDRTLCIVRA